MAIRQKSISGLERQIGKLKKKILADDKTMMSLFEQRLALAKLAAKGPAFNNPLEVMEAERLRDIVLSMYNMNSDGTIKNQR